MPEEKLYNIKRHPETCISFENGADDQLSQDYSKEAADIFPTAMENNFRVGSTIIDAVLQGSF